MGMHDPEKPSNAGINLKELVEAYERRLIESALADTGGNQRRAAASLGLLPTTLHEKMKRLGLLRRRPEDDEVQALAAS
jgi:two-component system, NtrC family, C4-dicarboxylate transport response regulator DctD